jgi:protease PrsW
MRSYTKYYPLLSLLILFSIFWLPQPTSAQDDELEKFIELAERYTPVLYFHPFELFRPQSVDVLVDTSRLRHKRPGWFDYNVLLRVSLSDLLEYRDSIYNLDSWIGDAGMSDYKNYTAHRAFYQAVLSPEVGGYPIVTYAHVKADEVSGKITIQYWLFYYYNDSFNKHEGDWEFAQVILSADGQPEWVVLSQHHGGTRRPWNAVQVEDQTHPAVYVALGSHANYFWGNESYPNGVTVGNTRVEILDRTGDYDRTLPQVILIPDRETFEEDRDAWQGLEWLLFQGRWGEIGVQADFSGPFGPADKGELWESPYDWGMAQMEDAHVWYANRFRVEVLGLDDTPVKLSLTDTDGAVLPELDLSGNTAILHDEAALDQAILAEIEAPAHRQFDVRLVWPDPEQSLIRRYTFNAVSLPPPGQAVIRIFPAVSPVLVVPGSAQEIVSTTEDVIRISHSRFDTVWMIGYLQANEVAVGLVLSLVAGVLPTLILVVALYRSDTYEKEPKHLLAAVFLWGAIPSLLIALVVRLFFNLPLDLLGTKALEAIRIGFISPLVEEAFKGAAVLFIAWRYRLEFDDLLDGIIYGAMAGFGFAMTANIFSYMGAFILHGFLGLGSTIFIEGILFGLNQAMYTAIFGAGLGYARMAQTKWQQTAVPIGAFCLAVAANGLHRLAMQNVIGVDLRSVVVTWIGLVALIIVMGASLRRQKQILVRELEGELPATLYAELTKPGALNRIVLAALWKGGQPGYRKARKFSQTCAELAFKKNQLRHFPDDQATMKVIEQLRCEIKPLIDSLEL